MHVDDGMKPLYFAERGKLGSAGIIHQGRPRSDSLQLGSWQAEYPKGYVRGLGECDRILTINIDFDWLTTDNILMTSQSYVLKNLCRTEAGGDQFCEV